MKDLRNVPVDLGDIPTKPIDKDKEGFYLFVQGDAKNGNSCKSQYRFPPDKKDLAMFVFYKLHNHQSETSEDDYYYDGYYHIIGYIPRFGMYDVAYKLTKISMFLCSEGKVLEVDYDPNYQVKEYNEIIKNQCFPNTARNYQYK